MNPSNVRKPRLRVIVDGAEVAAISAEVTNNNFFQADAWQIDCALFADFRYGIQWWDTRTGKPIEIAMGFEVSGSVSWTTLITGTADLADYDIDAGIVTLSGRDYTSRLIDHKTTETYQNMSASAIVQKLAAAVGMTADVTPTRGNVGRFYDQNTTHHSQSTVGQTQTAWDMVVFLARREGYDVWVTGTTIHFHPAGASTEQPRIIRVDLPTFTHPSLPVARHAPSEVSRLRLNQREHLARDVKIVVSSFNSRTGRRIERSYPSADRRVRSTSQGQQVTLYEFQLPDATEEQLLQEAQRKYLEIIQHTREVSWEEPGELLVNPRRKVLLSGDLGSYAQEYFVDSVTRRIRTDGGFTQEVRAKNKAPSQEEPQ
ncbi:phage late control D family protein [Teichococcus deserti]|uniref:phage late control D family protein n=1 Tax=Teichococcus deserti TaxID=1817963 RepID=UPI001055E717|nr:phage late control D family protein [Pseudoroseomonas deserti]